MAIAGKLGAVYVQTTDAATAFTNEATTKNGDFTRWTITAATKRYWDKDTAVTVKKNGGTITTGFTIEYVGGVIVFNPAILTSDVITVSGKYWTVSQVGGFFNWSLDAAVATEEATAFGDSFKGYVPTLAEWSGSAEKYWGDAAFLTALGTEVVVVLYADASSSYARYEGFAVITADGAETPVDGLITETIDFTGNGALYYRP
jgi:hypothetical protein